ncbi:unnamed protein product [Caenorhabditis angaria]|uniref:Uncharacterized protein n=1 Tax=Caenorhabditis angaria TaxID=860376 RepID=A0A9P1J7T6_9PELO|nr:unnamed protein product [Caenorhabditis angaria]
MLTDWWILVKPIVGGFSGFGVSRSSSSTLRAVGTRLTCFISSSSDFLPTGSVASILIAEFFILSSLFGQNTKLVHLDFGLCSKIQIFKLLINCILFNRSTF